MASARSARPSPRCRTASTDSPTPWTTTASRPTPIPIVVTITKRGDTLALDFSGSGPQCAGDINVVYFALLATVYYALKAVLDPTIPANSGFYRAITVTAPEGSIVNARPPAPVAWRTQTCQRIADVVLGALAEVVPERVPAAGNGANCAMVFSGTDPRTGEALRLPRDARRGAPAPPRPATAWTPCRCT